MRKLIMTLALTVAMGPAALAAQSAATSANLAPATPASVVNSASVAAPAPAATIRPMAQRDVAGIQLRTDAKAPLAVSSAAAEGLHKGEGVALMAVGGAALVAGLLIGDDAGTAVALGGLVVGLVGLYEYVR